LSTLDGNFHEKRAAIQTFFEQNPELIDEPGSGYKDFIRWQEFWSARVNETGNYFTANDAMLAYQNDISLYCNGSSSIDVNWELLGPISTPPRVDLNSPNYGSHGMGITRAVWVNPANPNHILLGSGSGGLWKSMDGGQNWTNITDSSGLMTLGVNSIAVHPITGFIYITTGIESSFWGLSKYYGFGLLKSADGGNSWETTGLSFSPGGPLPVAEKVVFDESDITGQRAFALVEHQILETTDFGVTWSVVLTGQVSERFTDIDFNPITPTNWVACSSDGTESFEPNVPGKFYRSSNNGNSWSEFTNSISLTPITYATLEYSEAGVDVIYAAIAFDGATDKVFKSSDNGITWTEQGNVPGGWKGTFEVSKFDENRLYFGCLNVVQSNDGGLTNTAISDWFNLTSINYIHADHRDLKSVEIGGQEYLYSAHDGGLGRKLISESAWEDLSGNGLTISQIYAVGVGSSGKVYGGMQDLSTNFYDGNAWFNIGQGDGGNCMVDYLAENVT